MRTAAPAIVVDTSVLAGAMLTSGGLNRQVIRACLTGRANPILGEPLFLEYEDVLGRKGLFRKSPLSPAERQQLFEAFLNTCEWTPVFYLWRPNLRDEADNHLVELAVAGGASMIVTNNIADFRYGEFRFPAVRAVTPKAFLEVLP